MTERKRPKEQIAYHSYKQQVSLPVSHPVRERRGVEAGLPVASRLRKRVVTTPEVVQSPATWSVMADRREQLRRANAKSAAHTRLVPRTLAQTGYPAAGGQMHSMRQVQARRKSLPVPVRSGQRSGQGTGVVRRVLAFFGILLIGILGVSFALTSSAFRVQQVSVVGTQNSMLVQNIQHMGMQGQNIFLVDVGALTAQIEALPMIASASLGKQLPNQLTVSVVERTPVLLWQTKQGAYSVDGKGVVIAPASETTGSDHLGRVDAGNTRQSIHPGVQLNRTDIAFAMEALDRLPQVMGNKAFTLRYDPKISVEGGSGSYIVESSDSWLAYLGGADNSNPLDNRLNELQQILVMAQQQQLNLATIDLRYGLRPVYTLKS